MSKELEMVMAMIDGANEYEKKTGDKNPSISFSKNNLLIIEKALQRLEAIESKQKDVMFNCCILDTNEFTPKMRKYCLYKIGKRIVKDSLLGLKFRVTQLNLCDQLPSDIKGIRVQARFKYVILEDVLKNE